MPRPILKILLVQTLPAYRSTPLQSMRSTSVIFDYVIVGAGSSGCAVANRVSQSSRNRVLLLEAGPRDHSLIVRVPCATRLTWKRYDWGSHSAPDPTRNQKSECWIHGRILGGSSSINGMNYVRGSSSDYDRWSRLGNHGWDADSVMPIFKSIERCDTSISDADHLRGRQGVLHVRKVKNRHDVTEAFVEAAQSVGHNFNDDYNSITQEGVGYTQLTQLGGKRWSAADAFLKPALSRKNLELVVGAHVHKVLMNDRRAYGVLYERDGIRHEARARHVVLCGGAINTPKLLMLSGIGDPAPLSKHGIAVVLDRKSVGQGLLEHPCIRLVYRLKAPTYNLTKGFVHKARVLSEYLLKGQGPMASMFEAMAFLRTAATEPNPDIQLHFAPMGLDFEQDAAQSAVQTLSAYPLLPYPSVTVWLNKSHPVSRGRIGLTTPDPQAPPLIEPQLLADDRDIETLVRGVVMVRRIMAAAPIGPLVVGEVGPSRNYTSVDSIRNFVIDNTTITYHPAGTCRMGVDDDAVVTPELRVRGIENLWISDASVMPDLISGNTNAACMMIGEKLGRALAADAV